MKKLPRVAAVQLTSSDDVEENLEKIEHYSMQAAGKGAQLVSFPENCVLMPKSSSQLVEVAQQQSIQIRERLTEISKANEICLIAGSIPFPSEDVSRVYGTCLAFGLDGNIVGRYQKMHLFDVTISSSESYLESDYTKAGEEVVCIDTPVGRVGLTICYDIRFPELYRGLGRLQADIFNIPSAFTVPTGIAHWEVLLRARAIENLSYVIAPAQVGNHPSGRKTYGHTMIIDPWGKVLSSKGSGEGVCYASIDLAHLNSVRSTFPARDHRRFSEENLNYEH